MHTGLFKEEVLPALVFENMSDSAIKFTLVISLWIHLHINRVALLLASSLRLHNFVVELRQPTVNIEDCVLSTQYY